MRFTKWRGQQICLWLLLKYSHFIFARQRTCSTRDDDDENDEKNDENAENACVMMFAAPDLD